MAGRFVMAILAPETLMEGGILAVFGGTGERVDGRVFVARGSI
jgi:hypothetical protein